MRFVVCLESLPYPFRGYKLTAKRVSRKDKRIWDSLSPDVVKHMFVEAKNVEQAKAVGLKEFVEEAEGAKGPPAISPSSDDALCLSTTSALKENKIMLRDGRIVEIPEECRTVEEVFNWLKSNYGKDHDFLISELDVYIPEIDKNVHFLESDDGILISTTTIPRKTFKKIKDRYPFIEPAYIM